MIKLKWILLLCLGLIALQTRADQAIVIDAQTIGEPPAASKPNSNSPTQAVAPVTAAVAPAESAESETDRILKSGKVSPKQKAEIMKAELLISNKRESEAFLSANKAKPGVVSLPSGVQYKILRPSKGKTPSDNSAVVCRYRGTLIDGTSFDKSDAKKPLTLKVSGLSAGLKEAIKLMPAGSKWQIFVPPQLGFGERGSQGAGPNAALIYEFEIISVK